MAEADFINKFISKIYDVFNENSQINRKIVAKLYCVDIFLKRKFNH